MTGRCAGCKHWLALRDEARHVPPDVAQHIGLCSCMAYYAPGEFAILLEFFDVPVDESRSIWARFWEPDVDVSRMARSIEEPRMLFAFLTPRGPFVLTTDHFGCRAWRSR